MSELKPCPFCGGKAETWDGAGPWHVVCTKCGTIGSPCLSEAEAIAAWNSRAERTCEPKWTLQGKTQTQEFWRCECGNCGYEFGVEDRRTFPFEITIDEVDVPNFCPECGAKQKVVGE